MLCPPVHHYDYDHDSADHDDDGSASHLNDDDEGTDPDHNNTTVISYPFDDGCDRAERGATFAGYHVGPDT